MKTLYFIGAFLVSIAFVEVRAARELRPDSVSNALNEFALKFLLELSKQLPEDENIAVSPYTIWTAMAIVNEGARANTAAELEKILGIPPDIQGRPERNLFRGLQQDMVRNIAQKQEGVALQVLNSLFTKLDANLKPNFKELVRQVYGAEVELLNFGDTASTARYINDKLSNFTRGRVRHIVNEEDVRNAEMVLTSALFFKGLWDKQFYKENTRDQPFYNDRKQIIATVPMMRNNGTFPFATRILHGLADAVEIPYKGDRMVMIAVVPRDNVPLSNIVSSLAETPISEITNELKLSKEVYQEEELRISMPRFKISTDLKLNNILQAMGMLDVFNERYADLSRMSPKNLYVSNVVHKAQIEVDENGTVGSAVTAVEITNRIPSPFIVLNRPFAYVIFDKKAQCVVFAGRYSNPKKP